MNAEQKRLATMLLGHYAKGGQITVQNEVSDGLIMAIKDRVDLVNEIRKQLSQHVGVELMKKSRIAWTDSMSSYGKKYRADAWIFTPEEIAELAINCFEAGLRSQEVNL
jgi:hypothetical protein